MPRERASAKERAQPQAGTIERLHIVQPGSVKGNADWVWVLVPAHRTLYDQQLRPIVLQQGVAIQVPTKWVVDLPIDGIDQEEEG